MGLTLAQKMIQLHGGTIKLESTLGKGSRFTVILPKRVPDPLPNTPPEQCIHHAATWQNALIIEDSVITAEQLERYLHEMKIEAVHRASASSALWTAQAIAPDLIFLDSFLADGGGWDLFAQLKQSPQTCDIPIVIVSVADEQTYAMQQGASAYLTKPFTRENLHEVFKVLIDHQAAPVVAAPVAAKSQRLMLVEDNEYLIELFSDYLSVKGYLVDVKRNGLEAVQQVGVTTYDLILMDLQMPEMNGLEAIRHIRQDGLCIDTPILVLTAHSMPGDQERCMNAGANGFLSKPVQLLTLISRIESLLQ